MVKRISTIYLVSTSILLNACYSYHIKKYTACSLCIASALPKKNGIYLYDAGYDSTERMNAYKSFMLYNDCTVLGGANSVIYATPANARAKISEWYMKEYNNPDDKKIWGCYTAAGDSITLQRPIPIAAGIFGGEWDVMMEAGKVLSDTSILITGAIVKNPATTGGNSVRNEVYIFFEMPAKPDSTNWLRKKIDGKK